jgi:hypothetical protein
MPTLTEILTNDTRKSEVVDACCELIDLEVADKGGISGLAIKAGYGVVKGVKPGFIRKVVTDLLPEFATAIEPVYQDAKTQAKAVPAFFAQNSSRVADALLAITDGKAQRSQSGAVKGTYEKLRGSAKKNVEAAVPRLAKMVDRFAP